VVHHLHPGDILLHPIGLELILLPVGQEVVDGVLQLILVATDPRCDGLPRGVSNSVAARGPESWSLVSAELCPALALNSTHPGCGTSLIRYLGAVVMPRCPSRAQSLLVRTRASAPKDSISSASRYIFWSMVSLGGGYSSLALSSTSWSFSYCCSSAGEPLAIGLSGTTSSVTKGSSSCDAC
jgi:hypothetical protein